MVRGMVATQKYASHNVKYIKDETEQGVTPQQCPVIEEGVKAAFASEFNDDKDALSFLS